jgi:hypothetical protein
MNAYTVLINYKNRVNASVSKDMFLKKKMLQNMNWESKRHYE